MHFLLNLSLLAAAGTALALPIAARADDGDVPPITVRPHLEGAAGLRLEQRGREGDEWITVCNAPCDRSVPLDGTYRVAGPNIVTSGDFQLHGRIGERVTVTVDPTSTDRRETGKGILIGGAIALGTGVTLASMYALWGLVDAFGNTTCDVSGAFSGGTSSGVSASGSATCGNASPPKGLLWASVGTLVLGAGGLIAGLVVMSPTSTKQAPAIRVDDLPSDRWEPPPQVNGPASYLPVPQSMPVLSGTF